MSSARILLVEDDTLMRRSLTFSVEQVGYRVSTAASAEDALALAQRDPPDLILLDIELPGMNGLQALSHFQEHRSVAIIFITARRRELDQVLGLELGADDYITKPFDLEVLLARIKTVLRRSRRSENTPAEPARLVVGDLEIDPSAHTVIVGGQRLDLPPCEFDLLYTLALEPGHVVSVHDLLASIWGTEYQNEAQVVYVHMRWLREKLEKDPRHPRRIVTVRSVGYKLEPQEA